MTDPILFLLAVLTILGTPGPTNTLLATSGAMVGFQRSLPLLAGELAGYAIAVAAIRILLGPLLAAVPLVGIGLKLAVIAYIVWMAIRLWRRGSGGLTEAGAEIKVRNVFLTTLLNPKALIFSLSVLPQEHPLLWAYVAAFFTVIPLAGSGWILLGRTVGLVAGERHTGTIRRVASVALFGFAGLIASTVAG